MFKIATTTAAAATALALTGVAGLADSRDTDAMPDFPWSQEEFLQAVPEARPGMFVEVDTTGDGMISEEEYHQAVEAGLIAPPQEG